MKSGPSQAGLPTSAQDRLEWSNIIHLAVLEIAWRGFDDDDEPF